MGQFSKRCAGFAFVALLAGAAAPAAASALTPGCVLASGGTSETCTYVSGEGVFTVPAGVTAVSYILVGGHGGAGSALFGGAGAPGGAGDEVIGSLAVAPGETLFADVGGNGGN